MTEVPALAAKEVAATISTNYPTPFAERVAGREKHALGDFFGISGFGVNMVTLPPGAQSSVRHRHTVQEEFVYVLEGELILVHDAGEMVCTPGMCAGFVPDGTAHHFINRSGAPAAFLVVGDRRPGDRGIYPDDDLQAVHRDGAWQFTRKDGRPYA
jgi:uncharacterized cupin superfamily protein